LQGREVLYATKTATEQLRKIYGVSVEKIEQQYRDDIVITTVTVRDKTGRTDGATGAVNISNLRGDALANAVMKSETKAKRRATLSICGLGMLDESEIETIPGALPPMSTTASIISNPADNHDMVQEKIDKTIKDAINSIWVSQTVEQLVGVGENVLRPLKKYLGKDQLKPIADAYSVRMSELTKQKEGA